MDIADKKQCKIKAIKPLPGVYVKYQPEVGKIYDAEYCTIRQSAICIINILDKRIVLRQDEFEIVEE